MSIECALWFGYGGGYRCVGWGGVGPEGLDNEMVKEDQIHTDSRHSCVVNCSPSGGCQWLN